MSGPVCFYSGIEAINHFRSCSQAGIKTLLASYYSMQNRDPDMVKKWHAQDPKLRFFIDSGAHTFITDRDRFKDWKLSKYEDYVRGYCDWLLDNKDIIDCAVEFDIDYCLNMNLVGKEDSTIGPGIVEKWQDKYFKPLEREGIEIIYVWHEQRKLSGWEEMCHKFSYVGLPGEFSGKGEFHKFMEIAKQYCVKVHGFGCNKKRDYSDAGWYSFDSTSWKSAEMYGVFIDWNPVSEKLTFLSKLDKHKRRHYRDKIAATGLDVDAIINDTDYKECTKWNLMQLEAVHAFYRSRFAKKTFPYDLRLPHRNVISSMKLGAPVSRLLSRINFDEVFPEHQPLSKKEKRKLLMGLSSAQRGDYTWLRASPDIVDFLKCYLPGLCSPLVSDMSLLQKGLSELMLPKRQEALKRGILPLSEMNRPRERGSRSFSIEDLEHDHTSTINALLE